MHRQRLTIGTFGNIRTRLSTTGRYVARTCYRDWDGHARLVQASGATVTAAGRALKSKLADRDLFQPADTTLTPDSLWPSIRLAGTIVSRNGEQTFRQDHPKTAKSRRVVALSTFTADAVRRRLVTAGSMGLWMHCCSSRGTAPR